MILSGEGILGLEAACASLIEAGDRVLCLDNGIFGNGFIDFAKMYGGNVVSFDSDYQKGIDIDKLKGFLEKDHDFKVATLVHCETPSGITNPIEIICPLLNSYGIITVVDSVSAIGGETLKTDEWKIDMVLGGSQKCLSAPPGLTFLSVSKIAWNKILNRETPIVGYYSNLSYWKNWYQEKWFPYTQPVSDIFGLRAAVDNWLQEENPILRHKKIAEATRQSLIKAGLSLYPQDHYSNTVTTVKIPSGITFKEIYDEMLQQQHILIGGAFGYLKDQVFRIGHMGENCYEEKLYLTLKALSKVLINHKVRLEGQLHEIFLREMK
nr:alanine--glyoxylate aminotransferase family protein [Alkaliphilus hydrothermalis]